MRWRTGAPFSSARTGECIHCIVVKVFQKYFKSISHSASTLKSVDDGVARQTDSPDAATFT